MRARDVGAGARRVLVARILLLVFFLALAARAAHLSTDERGSARGIAQTQRVLRLPPERGVIFDRNGAELALSIDAPSVYANPSALADVDRAARRLAAALGADRRAIATRLSGQSPFVFVSRWVTDERAQKVKELGLEGVGVLYEPRRVYPNRGLAAQVVGFANIDGEGVRGLEQQEDEWLRGTPRRLPVERDARGRLLVNAGGERWRTAGGDIALTIDAALQADAEDALRASIEATGARGGVVISMDPRNGDVLALTEVPTFDPNYFRELDYRITRSRSFLDAADPGSALKIFLMAAALERGAIAPEDRFDCENGTFRVPGSVIHDSHPHGVLTAAEILQVSSNIGAAKIAFALGRTAHFDLLRRFGFGEVTGVGFPGESSGVLRPWQQWRPLDHATIAFGQGVAVTPIQLAAAAAALANGGEWVRPRLVMARRGARGAWQPTRVEGKRRVVRPETAAAVLAMMEGVVGPEGTAQRAALPGVRVAGKTGTAQKFDPGTATYTEDRFAAWFIGIVPSDDPKLVIVAGIDEPRRPVHTGGAAAAPLFARVASAQLARFGVFTEPQSGTPRYTPPSGTPAPIASAADPNAAATPSPVAPRATSTAPVPRVTKSNANATEASIEAAASPAETQLVSIGDRMLLPDFHGLTESEVRRITANTPLDVKMTGHGRAVAQEPPAGTILARNRALVHIRFESSGPGDEEGES
jgi:cell division protein FtsI (penicillin-binding protein 3)